MMRWNWWGLRTPPEWYHACHVTRIPEKWPVWEGVSEGGRGPQGAREWTNNGGACKTDRPPRVMSSQCPHNVGHFRLSIKPSNVLYWLLRDRQPVCSFRLLENWTAWGFDGQRAAGGGRHPHSLILIFMLTLPNIAYIHWPNEQSFTAGWQL